MKILVIGSGGREHALVWALSKSHAVKKIYCAPGNAGTAETAQNVPINPTDIGELLSFAKENKIDFTVVGPEAPLTLGIVDVFRRNGLKIFGPNREAAELEASKVFTKNFCKKYNIPTARAEVFSTVSDALSYAKNETYPLVVKADGLAQGKGVIICESYFEAEEAIRDILEKCKFGEAGNRLIVEEMLTGEEVSFLAFSDGNHVLPLASSQDHKRIGDGDLGPNTGGMGAYSPAPVVTADLYDRIMSRIVLPTVRGMVTEGRPFTGILYAGLMIRDKDPYLLEYNVRFGDPEAQPLLMRLKTDLFDVLQCAVEGNLNKIHLEWDPRPAVCVVMSQKGYPGPYTSGEKIIGIQDAEKLGEVKVFHAGTKIKDGEVVTAGGRVLGVTAIGSDISKAIENAYEAVDKIHWGSEYFRRDIGKKALQRS